MKLSQIAKPLGFIAIAAIPAGSNLLLTLVLLRGLGIDGFAFWSLVEPMMMIFGTVGALGIQYGLLFTTASRASEPRHGLGAAFTLAAPLAVVLASLVWLVSRPWLGPVGYLSLVLPLVAETLSMLAISSLRGQRRTGAWILFETIRSLGLVAIAFLALRLDLSWVRSVDSFLILRGTFTMAAVITVAFVLKARLGVDRALMVRMIRYGLPIAGAAMIANMTTSADRFIMAALDVDLSVIASYAAHQRLTGIMGVLTVTPLNLWFAVEAMRRDTVAEAGFFQAVVIILLLALSTLMLGAFLLAPLLWPWLFPGLEFNPVVFAILTLAIVPQALGIVLNIGGLREKKTHLNAIVVACGTTAMLALGFPLIHFAAAAGAATARLGTYVVTATAGRALSQRISPVHHEVVPLLPVLGAIAAAIGSLFYGAMGLPIWLMPVVTVLLVLFVLRRESARLRQLLGQRAPATTGEDQA